MLTADYYLPSQDIVVVVQSFYKLVPTTWREMGLGVYGRINSASLRYQAYVMNGFISYNGAYKLKGTNGLRSGRQKGAESVGSNANFAARALP